MPPKPTVKSDHSDVEDAQVDENELNQTNVTKYTTAADIANRALKVVIEACVDGALIGDLCRLGDSTLQELAKSVYNKPKGILKGIAFPTTVSPNSIICHLSPLSGDAESQIALKNGDTVRIEMGAHVDGYVAQVAHTLVVGASKENPITGRQADAILAAHTAIEAAIRLLKPGNTNWEVTDVVQKIAEEFGCKPVEGMLSHQIQRNRLDGEKQIILNPQEATRKEMDTHEFVEGEVYSLDVLVSTGEGKPRTQDARTTIFKRTEETYLLKLQASRKVFSEVNSKFGTMAFSLRQLDDEKKARMGIVELSTHGLVTPYNVLYEKDDAFVAHFMYTALLLPNGPLKITSYPALDLDVVKSEKSVQDEKIKDLLRAPVRANKNKKKAKKAGAKDE
ncbi:peptidase M24, structural domain-containing protein [Cladochytrium replicatum]|nr:peptidase M24, structural domain-containing protein [Cladochytrium replicatum]